MDARCNLPEKFHPLAGDRRLNVRETGDVPAWSGKALDKTAADRIGDDGENNRDSASLLQQCRSGGRVVRDDDVRLQCDDFHGETSPRVWVVGLCPANI